MSIIQIKNVDFTYDGAIYPVFEKLNLVFDDTWKLGLIGRNGTGKTTLMKILSGQLSYSGTINSTVEFSYFPFYINDQESTGIDIFREHLPNIQPWIFEREASLLEMQADILDRPYSTLSGGEKTKLQLAILFSQEDMFHIIDEPTNHLDLLAREQVAQYLNSKDGFILASHDRNLLDHCCDHIVSLNPSGASIEKGNYSSWKENMDRKNQYEIEQNSKLKKDIVKLSHSARRTENWSHKIEASKIGSHAPDRGYVGRKAADMMQRSKNIQSRRDKAVYDKTKLLKDVVENENVELSPSFHHASELVRIRNLNINYDKKTVLEDFSMTMKNGEIIAISGSNGSGKTSILKTILGEIVPYTGEVEVASGLKIAYLSQSSENISGNVNEFIFDEGIDKSLYFAILRKLGFSREQFEISMDNYSEGQKKKAMLAANLCKSADVYIWDEPLNYIDLNSRIQIEDMIVRARPSMILVEHDRVFLKKIGARIINI